MPIFKDLSPLDNMGLQDHRPTREVKWAKLENVVFRDGGLARRPGVIYPTSQQNGSLRDTDYPNVKRGVPCAIMEIENPGSSSSGREGFKWITETEVPNANAEIVAGWSGAFGDIDEDPGDAAATMSSGTDGAQESIGYTNLTGDFDAVSHVVFRGRARTYGVAMPQTLNLYYRSGSTNYLMASIVIYPFQDGEQPS